MSGSGSKKSSDEGGSGLKRMFSIKRRKSVSDAVRPEVKEIVPPVPALPKTTQQQKPGAAAGNGNIQTQNSTNTSIEAPNEKPSSLRRSLSFGRRRKSVSTPPTDRRKSISTPTSTEPNASNPPVPSLPPLPEHRRRDSADATQLSTDARRAAGAKITTPLPADGQRKKSRFTPEHAERDFLLTLHPSYKASDFAVARSMGWESEAYDIRRLNRAVQSPPPPVPALPPWAAAWMAALAAGWVGDGSGGAPQPGVMPGAIPGAMPGGGPGSWPGIVPGGVPGAWPSAGPGGMPPGVPGAWPGAGYFPGSPGFPGYGYGNGAFNPGSNGTADATAGGNNPQLQAQPIQPSQGTGQDHNSASPTAAQQGAFYPASSRPNYFSAATPTGQTTNALASGSPGDPNAKGIDKGKGKATEAQGYPYFNPFQHPHFYPQHPYQSQYPNPSQIQAQHQQPQQQTHQNQQHQQHQQHNQQHQIQPQQHQHQQQEEPRRKSFSYPRPRSSPQPTAQPAVNQNNENATAPPLPIGEALTFDFGLQASPHEPTLPVEVSTQQPTQITNGHREPQFRGPYAQQQVQGHSQSWDQSQGENHCYEYRSVRDSGVSSAAGHREEEDKPVIVNAGLAERFEEPEPVPIPKSSSRADHVSFEEPAHFIGPTPAPSSFEQPEPEPEQLPFGAPPVAGMQDGIDAYLNDEFPESPVDADWERDDDVDGSSSRYDSDEEGERERDEQMRKRMERGFQWERRGRERERQREVERVWEEEVF